MDTPPEDKKASLSF